ncbi:MAG: hypothetical protein U0M06_13730 [Clostridia bacterium]|nr:hypothetical protein [Clostridia bacterium]
MENSEMVYDIETGELLTAGADSESVMIEAVESEADFKFEPQNFVDNLSYMGIGMLGIFVVIGVIIGCTALLNKVFKN